MPASPSATTTHRYAMVRAAGITLAVPVHEVGQALPLNASTGPVPRSQRALVGVFHHRGQVVPVVDLACWGSLQQDGAAATHAHVLILQHAGRLTGIAIECTVGVALVDDGAVHRVHHEGSMHELFHSVLNVAGCEHPIALLDTARLMQQTQVWVEAAAMAEETPDAGASSSTPPAAHSATDTTDPAGTQIYVVAELAGLRFALPVQSVGTIMQTPRMQKLPHLAKGLQGVFTWDRRAIPVVRIHQELGLAAPPPDSPAQAWVVVVHTPGAALGILVDQLVAVRRLESSRLQPAVTPLSTGMVPDPSDAQRAPIQLLSAAALLSAWPMAAMGARSHGDMQPPDPRHTRPHHLPGSGPGAQATHVPQEAHLIIQAGRSMATRLSQIQEIALRARARGDADLPCPTHFPWRGTWLPLLDLRLATEGVPCIDGPGWRVLIVKQDHRLTALAVEAVIDLVPAFAGSLISLRLNQGRSLEVLTAEVAGKQRSYEIVDLAPHAHAFQYHGANAQDPAPSLPPDHAAGRGLH